MIVTPIRSIVFIFFLSIFLTSCATLNKDECRTADWKLIGFEDGSKGYSASRIGDHRKACAEYGITPNLSLYNQGYAEGLHKFCTPANGYNLGRRGSAYHGICSGYDEEYFLSAYKQGKELYLAFATHTKMQNSLKYKQEELDHISIDIHEKENHIVNGKLIPAQIVLLLIEIRELAVEQGVVINKIHDLEHELEQQASYISHLKQQNQY